MCWRRRPSTGSWGLTTTIADRQPERRAALWPNWSGSAIGSPSNPRHERDHWPTRYFLSRHLRRDIVGARMTSDEAHIRFMTLPGAHLVVSLGADNDGRAELLLLGNRAGLLSFANVVLWLRAVASRRELLSFSELPFVETKGPIALHIRIAADDATGSRGPKARPGCRVRMGDTRGRSSTCRLVDTSRGGESRA